MRENIQGIFPSGGKLGVSDIRALAAAEGYVETTYNLAENILSFVHYHLHSACLLRVVMEVYLATGDVSTFLPHPRQKNFRIFHLNALSSPDAFARVLQFPWNNAGSAYNFSSLLSNNANSQSSIVYASQSMMSEKRAIEKQLVVIDREIQELTSEKDDLQHKLSQLLCLGGSSVDGAVGVPSLGGQYGLDGGPALVSSITSIQQENERLRRELEYLKYSGHQSRKYTDVYGGPGDMSGGMGESYTSLDENNSGQALLRANLNHMSGHGTVQKSQMGSADGGYIDPTTGAIVGVSPSGLVIQNGILPSGDPNKCQKLSDPLSNRNNSSSNSVRRNNNNSTMYSPKGVMMGATSDNDQAAHLVAGAVGIPSSCSSYMVSSSNNSAAAYGQSMSALMIPMGLETVTSGTGVPENTTKARVRGNRCVFALGTNTYRELFSQYWNLKPVSSVGLGRGFIILYDDGTVGWHDVCPLLETKLANQNLCNWAEMEISGKASNNSSIATSTNSPPTTKIKYAVLGTDSNFYVKFDDGRMEWCGPDAFGDALRKGVNEDRLLVDKVAFGPNGGWFVLWSNGSFCCDNLPPTLEDRLSLRLRATNSSLKPDLQILSPMGNPAIGLKDLTIGPNGEWFVFYKDHSVQADNLPDPLYKTLSSIREAGGRVRSLVFGDARSWFARYWDGGGINNTNNNNNLIITSSSNEIQHAGGGGAPSAHTINT